MNCIPRYLLIITSHIIISILGSVIACRAALVCDHLGAAEKAIWVNIFAFTMSLSDAQSLDEFLNLNVEWLNLEKLQLMIIFFNDYI